MQDHQQTWESIPLFLHTLLTHLQLQEVLTGTASLVDDLYPELDISAADTIYSSLPTTPSPQSTPVNQVKNAWLPTNECQFKCCHRCRPSSADRAFISINSVANGDLLPTAVVGFGFGILGRRPIIPVKHIRNLGLRPSKPAVSLFLSISVSPVIIFR